MLRANCRRTRRAIGALAQLPGVTTSIATAGDSIVRETLPGESRFESQ
jgi:hypothetical protein